MAGQATTMDPSPRAGQTSEHLPAEVHGEEVCRPGPPHAAHGASAAPARAALNSQEFRSRGTCAKPVRHTPRSRRTAGR
eukprot:CAMPEP_0198553650 /NCGR_PEP_ID=MMETSP1462-20131121/80976_1 /TAXON_ID=1333877 /ORGANISM="Brandtodinium nutriculum, Strain RCC3387" /LENGTH=78 /DNA_ID=CAMNT_0044284341 /DNA_START=64 /DNA_END=297 /DNA_ORIENTATION=-